MYRLVISEWQFVKQKGRKNVYLTGDFLRKRYGKYLGNTYSPNKFWLQTSSIDRTKMTGLILSAALWKPNEKQAFLPYVDWQPVSLHYWERPEDRVSSTRVGHIMRPSSAHITKSGTTVSASHNLERVSSTDVGKNASGEFNQSEMRQQQQQTFVR